MRSEIPAQLGVIALAALAGLMDMYGRVDNMLSY